MEETIRRNTVCSTSSTDSFGNIEYQSKSWLVSLNLVKVRPWASVFKFHQNYIFFRRK